MSNWTPEEVAARDRIMKQQAARDLCASLAQFASPLPLASPVVRKRDAVLPAVRASGRIRQPRGMNKTEQRYAQHLELGKRVGTVGWFKYEGLTLRLGDDTRYTADFAVLTHMGTLELHEVKGRRRNGKAYYEDDARVKIACAAEQFPFRFVMVWPGKSGEWESREF